MAPTETFTYTLPSGATVEIENLPDTARGARNVAAGPSGPTPLAEVLKPLGEVIDLVLDQLRAVVKKPDKVSVELGAALKGKSSLVIVSGETEATLKVTLTWESKATT